MTDIAFQGVSLRPNPEVIAKRLDQVAILVDVSTNRIFELNETGTRVWELLGQGLDADRIVHHLVNEFEVEEVRAADEVTSLFVRLQIEGLLAQ